MQEVTLIIRNKVGLHARPAALFVRTANRFTSKVVAIKDEHEANAKSILSVLTLGADQGAVVTVRAEGEDEAEAVEALKELVENNFGEKK
jgi:phosphotransferase system HPr (HPr) family protein